MLSLPGNKNQASAFWVMEKERHRMKCYHQIPSLYSLTTEVFHTPPAPHLPSPSALHSNSAASQETLFMAYLLLFERTSCHGAVKLAW
jgi:hypothetical protein